jgi:hypothetical protein
MHLQISAHVEAKGRAYPSVGMVHFNPPGRPPLHQSMSVSTAPQASYTAQGRLA